MASDNVDPIAPGERWFVVEHAPGGISIQGHEGGAGRLIVQEVPESKAHPTTHAYKRAKALAEFIARAPDMQREIERLQKCIDIAETYISGLGHFEHYEQTVREVLPDST